MENFKERLSHLPDRIIAAFAARCARRVEPLYHLPEGTPDAVRHVRSVARAIEIAEQSPYTEGSSIADVARAADTAANAARPAPTAYHAAKAAYYAAEAAYYADREIDVEKAAYDDDETAYAAASRAADEAEAASLAAGGELGPVLDRDLDALAAIDVTEILLLGFPIDGRTLGPLWPDGEPAWYRETKGEAKSGSLAETDTGGESELVLKIEVPENATDEEVLSIARDLALRADDLHRALGGHGLRVDALEIFGRAPVPQGVPRG